MPGSEGNRVADPAHGAFGIAVLDEFTVADAPHPGVNKIPIAEPTEFQTYFAYRKDATLSSFCEFFIAVLREEMQEKSGQNSSRVPARGGSMLSEKNNIMFAIHHNLVFDVTSTG